jgi:branched-chain amino acid transport system permease protein
VFTLFGIDIVLFSLDLGITYFLFLAISITLNLEFGYSGIANFGKMLYIAAGASIGGTFAGRFAVWITNLGSQGDFITNNFAIVGQVNTALQGQAGNSLLILALSLVVAAIAGGLLGLATSYIVKRIRADYFAMALFSVAQVYNIVLNSYTPLVGGSLGISLPNPFAWAGDNSQLVAGGAITIFAILVYIYGVRTSRSPLGRTLRAIRENEDSSEAFGKDSVAMRRRVLIIASAISSMAGLLYAFYTLDVYSQTFQYTTWTIYPWLMMVMGGIGNNLGVAFGTFLYLFIIKITDVAQFSFQGYLPFSVTWLQYFLIGGLLMAVLFLRPEGLLPEKPTRTLSKSKLRELRERLNSAVEKPRA